eukprot:scaffold265666_cov18-Prasinocladus_malaysianus.AAC.1
MQDSGILFLLFFYYTLLEYTNRSQLAQLVKAEAGYLCSRTGFETGREHSREVDIRYIVGLVLVLLQQEPWLSFSSAQVLYNII